MFTIFMSAILIGVVLLVNNAILNPPESNTPLTSQPEVDPFSGLESFHESSGVHTQPQMSPGRTNPFESKG